MTRRGGREGRGRGRRTGLSLSGRIPGKPGPLMSQPIAGSPASAVERREAQRLGGKASQAFRSSHARASGRVSHTRPNGDSQNPFRQGAPVFGGNAGHHKGPRKPLAPPGAPFPHRGQRKKGPAVPTPFKQPGGGALAAWIQIEEKTSDGVWSKPHRTKSKPLSPPLRGDPLPQAGEGKASARNRPQHQPFLHQPLRPILPLLSRKGRLWR
jgi:hypothetical protein